MTEKQIKLRQQALALTVCTIVFMAVYNVTAWYASLIDHVSSFTFEFEKLIPFVPLSIIPYMASGFFFCLVFFSCQNKRQLKILTWRMLFVIITAGFFYVTVPLRFSFSKPDVSNIILGLPFSFLKIFDSPYNQSPSLHIVFAFIFWSVFKDLPKWRYLLMIWLIFLGISTLTTYQHHLIDILTGAILAHISFILIPYRKNDLQNRNVILANYYFLSGWIFISAALFLTEYVGRGGLLFFIPAVITFVAGFYFQRNIGYAASTQKQILSK